MVNVFKELIKSSRKKRQVLIGSPGVGKSLLLFLVALYRAYREGKTVVYIRKTTSTFELISLFYITKKDDSSITIHYNRTIKKQLMTGELLEGVLPKYADIAPVAAGTTVLMNKVLLMVHTKMMATCWFHTTISPQV
jgi:hypothetical protein